MSKLSDVEAYLSDLPDHQRVAHLSRIVDDKAAAQRRAERAQKEAEAEERRHSNNDALYASGEAEAEKFLAKSPRAYDLERYQ